MTSPQRRRSELGAAASRASRPKRTLQWVRRWAPAILGSTALAVGVAGFLAISHVFPHSGYIQRLFATLAMFTGGYVPLADPGSNPSPSAIIAIPSILAFGLTVFTAVWVVLDVTSKRLATAFRAWRSHPQLVVVGSEETATAIVKSALAQKIKTVLIAESEDSQAGRAAKGRALVVTVPSVETCHEAPAAKKLLTRSDNVVVATDSAPANLFLQEHIAPLRQHDDRQSPTADDDPTTTDDFRSLIAVVHDPVLADTLRPAEITKLTEEDVTCPAENIAEHLCHLIDAASTGARVIHSDSLTTLVNVVTVQVVAVPAGPNDIHAWPQLADTIELWVRRQSWARVFLNGHQRDNGLFNPVVPIRLISADEHLPSAGVNIRIYAGGPQAVVSRVVEDRTAQPDSLPTLTIMVANASVARAATSSIVKSGTLGNPDANNGILTGHEWLELKAPMPEASSPQARVIVVDPVAVGLDARLVVDDVNLQWARMFAQTYDFMFAFGDAIQSWEPGAPLADQVQAEQDKAEREAIHNPPEDLKDKPEADRIRLARNRARKMISNRYSNRLAVKHMITQLTPAYRVVKLPRGHPTCPVAPVFHTAEQMAEAEHNDWATRTWQDRSPRRRTIRQHLRREPLSDRTIHCSEDSGTVANEFTFTQLSDPPQEILKTVHGILRSRDSTHQADDAKLRTRLAAAAEYNRRIITETYPAIAAAFGYAIVPKNKHPFPTVTDDDLPHWPRYVRRGTVLADQITETATWTTETGAELTAEAGDWHVRDNSGREWYVGREYFTTETSTSTGIYRHKADNIFERVGTVRARPAVADEVIESAQGPVVAPAGGWILRGDIDGKPWTVTGHHFSRYYAGWPPPPSRTEDAPEWRNGQELSLLTHQGAP